MYRKISILAGLAAAFLVAGCAESQRPEPTGRAFFLGMNGMIDSPGVSFLIEERGLEVVEFKRGSAAQQFDDFSYNLNWDFVPLEDRNISIRLASQFVDTVAEQDYISVIAGQFDTPELFLWQRAERVWEGTETVAQLDFGHAATTFGAVDVYFAAPGTAPVLGDSVGTIDYGDITPPAEFTAGEFEITMTAAGDPATIIYQSGTINIPVAQTLTAVLFDADPSIPATAAVRLLNATGANAEVPDQRFEPTVRFLHVSLDEVDVDISINGDTANPILTGLASGELSDDVPIPAGQLDYTVTEAGNPGVILFEQSTVTGEGTRNTYFIHGDAGATQFATLIDDRRGRAPLVRLRISNMATNADSIDLYIVQPDTDISADDVIPRFGNIGYPLSSVFISLIQGDYEVWVTPFGDKTPLAGPIPFNVVNGEVIEMAIIDNVDPSIVDTFIYQR